MKIELNRAFRGMRGAVDDFVYKKFDGREIACGRPGPHDKPPSAAQQRVQNRLIDAAADAQMVYADPARRAPYEARAKAEGRSNVFALIVGDYLTPPSVTEVDLYGYHGQISDEVRVRATDDFEVVSVIVTFRTDAAVVLEKGPAIKKGSVWIYAARTVAPVDQDVAIEAEAFDRAGNSRTLEERWHA